jgi:DNA-binding beta-propeller fold protein YncE
MKLSVLSLCLLAACGHVEAPGADDAAPTADAASTADAPAPSPDAAPSCVPGHDTLYTTGWETGGVEVFDCLAEHADDAVGGDRRIAGASTGLHFGMYGGLAFDPGHDSLYVSETTDGTIRVWDHTSSIDGDVAPDRVIDMGGYPAGLALDPAHDRLYNSDEGGPQRVLVYAAAHTLTGTPTPVATLTRTQVFGVGLDLVHDRLYVATGDGVAVYDGASTLSGEVAASRTFTVAGNVSLQSVTIDPALDIAYVSDRAAGEGAVYAIANAGTASGTVVPVRTISGGGTGPHFYAAMEVQLAGDRLFAANDSADRIWIYDPASTAAGAGPATHQVLLSMNVGNTDGFLYVP